MSDTASQNATPRKLQEEIAYQISETGGRMTTFIIKNLTGDCTIPPYTNVRLIDCVIQSLNVSHASIIYIKGGEVKGEEGKFNVTNSAVLSEGTKWNAPVIFTNSKLEFNSNCEISQNLTLRDSSYLKSISNIWKGLGKNKKIAITAVNNSRMESLRDSWGEWDEYLWKAVTNSIIKVTNAATIDQKASKGLAILDGNSVLVISHPKGINIKDNNDALFYCTKNSRLELYNFSSLMAEGMLFKLNSSKAVIRNVNALNSKNNKIADLTDSHIEFSNVSSFESDTREDLFTSTNSTIIFNNVSSFKTKGIVFNLNQSNINFVFNSFDYMSDSAIGASIESTNDIAIKAIDSKIFVKNLSKIKSKISQAIDLTSSTFRGTNITNINGGSLKGIITGDKSKLILTNIKNISGPAGYGINLKNSKGLISNVISINSQGSGGAGINAIDYSSIVCKNVETIIGPIDGIALENYSSLIFKGNNTKILGNNSSGISIGIGCRLKGSNIDTISSPQGSGISQPTNSRKASIELNDIKNIKGKVLGINILGADLILNNSGISSSIVSGANGIKLYTSESLGTYKVTIIGPLIVDGKVAFNATNYQIEEQGVSWNGDVVTTNCLVKSIMSKTSGNRIGVQSYGDYIRNSFNNINLSDKSNFKLINSFSTGSTILDKSLLDLTLSTINKADLSNRAGLIADIANTANITLNNSFLRAFSSKIGSIILSGLSSALGGASQGIDISFSSGDGSYSSPTAYFVTSTGDLAFQADNDITMEALNVSSTVRENIIFTAPTGEVQYTGETDVILTTGSSTISMTDASITITSPSVSIN